MKPKDYPEVLYKYRSWCKENNRKIITENQLYLASPKDFNDPIDCRIGNNYSLLDTDEKIEEYAELFIKKHKDNIIEMGLVPDQEKEAIINNLKTDLNSFQKDEDELTNAMLHRCLGVLSMSTRFDSILMWSHYADNHKGFCVGFSETKMRESYLFGKGGPVIYGDEFPKIDPRNNKVSDKMFLQTFYKAKDWNYEKEYRLTKLFFPREPNKADRIIIVPNDFIIEVIIGLKTPNEHKKEIIEICNRKNIPIYQIEQVPFEFKLIKTPVGNIE